MSKSLNEWGRFLALVLRHKPEVIGIKLDAHGWAQVEALLVAFNRIEAFNMLMLEHIVAEDDKQRFAFSEDKKKIRANQGHSVKVDVELREAVPPELLYHGTGRQVCCKHQQTGTYRQAKAVCAFICECRNSA